MKESLRTKLNNWIKSENGKMISFDAIERQVKLWGYKMSNAERQLRPSLSPDIERVEKNGAIIGYRYFNSQIKQAVDQFQKDWPSPQRAVIPSGLLW